MALFDLIGRRWSLRILWELHRAGSPMTFRELRAACDGISSSVLTRRLRELDETLIVTHRGEGYELTAGGRGLVAAMGPLLDWSRDWGREMGL